MFLTTYYVQDNVLSVKYSLGAYDLRRWNMGRRESKPKIMETIDYLHVCLVPQRGHKWVLLSRPNPSVHQRRMLGRDTIETVTKGRLGVHLEKGKVAGKRAGLCKGPETETILSSSRSRKCRLVKKRGNNGKETRIQAGMTACLSVFMSNFRRILSSEATQIGLCS